MNSRHLSIRKTLKYIDGFLITDISNVRYLSGFTGSSAFLLITKSGGLFATDCRYAEQAKKEVIGWDIFIERGERSKTISKVSKRLGIKKLGFEASMSYGLFWDLSKKGLRMKPLKNAVERLRAVKDSAEIELIKRAVRRAESAFADTLPYIKKGVKEKKIALILEENLRKMGCSRLPFEIIVASGRNSSMPHARPTDKKFESGDMIVIDWGGEAGGYFSDMTRTLLVNGPDIGRKKEIYQIVLEANKKAISAIRPGIDVRKIDHSARDVIKRAGYGKLFGHGTGHGVGLQVHELPSITWQKKDMIKENMIFTIEPGIYVPEIGGVRIEDMALVGKKSATLLTTLSKELKII